MSSIPYFFETVPLSKPGAQWLMMLAGQWMPKKCLSLSLPTTIQGLKSSAALSLSCGSWNSKLRSSCLWNKLNETSPQPTNPNFKSPSVPGGKDSVFVGDRVGEVICPLAHAVAAAAHPSLCAWDARDLRWRQLERDVPGKLRVRRNYLHITT